MNHQPYHDDGGESVLEARPSLAAGSAGDPPHHGNGNGNGDQQRVGGYTQPRSLVGKCVVWCKIMVVIVLCVDAIIAWLNLAYLRMYPPPVHVVLQRYTSSSSDSSPIELLSSFASSSLSSLFNVTLSSSCASWAYSHDTSFITNATITAIIDHSNTINSNHSSIANTITTDGIVSWSPTMMIIALIYAIISHLTVCAYALSESSVVLRPPETCRRSDHHGRNGEDGLWYLLVFVFTAVPLIPLLVILKMIAVCTCLPFYPDVIQAYDTSNNGRSHPNQKIINVIKGISCTIGIPLSIVIIYSVIACGDSLMSSTPLGTCVILQAVLVFFRLFFLRVYWHVLVTVKDRIVQCIIWWCGDPQAAQPLLHAAAGHDGHGHGNGGNGHGIGDQRVTRANGGGSMAYGGGNNGNNGDNNNNNAAPPIPQHDQAAPPAAAFAV